MAGEFESYGLYEQPESGEYSGDGKTTYVFSGIANGVARARLEALFAGADDSGYCYFRGSCVLPKECRVTRDGYFETLTIVTGVPESSGGNSSNKVTKEYDETCELSTNPIEKPLETHPSYKACWNYDLWGAVPADAESPTAPSLPAWSLTATSITLTAAQQLAYAWSKEQPANLRIGGKEYRFVRIQSRTKPGVECYLVDAPIVTVKKYFKTYNSAVANLKTSNQLIAPPKTFGYASAASHWKCHPDGITEEDDFYVSNNVYQYADSWDADLYS